MVKKSDANLSFEIKNTDISVLVIKIKEKNIELFKNEITKEFGFQSEKNNFFNFENIILDINENDEYELDELTKLLEIIKSCKLNPIGINSKNLKNIENGKKLGLDNTEINNYKKQNHDNNEIKIIHEVKEVVRDVSIPTMIVDKTLRSGQKIYARGCDLVVLAMVNQGAEVISDGNIHIYAPLRGKAMAGARGNTQARIFTMCLEAELIAIAGVYRTSEHALPEDIRAKAAQIRLSDDGQERLLIESLKL